MPGDVAVTGHSRSAVITEDSESVDDQTSTRVPTSQTGSALSTGSPTLQELSTASSGVLSTRLVELEVDMELDIDCDEGVPLVPRGGYRAGDDGIGYLSAHTVSVSVKGPCHEQEGNEECTTEKCQSEMFMQSATTH